MNDGMGKKMNVKVEKCFLIGYDYEGYRIWTDKQKLIKSRDVVFFFFILTILDCFEL